MFMQGELLSEQNPQKAPLSILKTPHAVPFFMLFGYRLPLDRIHYTHNLDRLTIFRSLNTRKYMSIFSRCSVLLLNVFRYLSGMNLV